MAEGVWTLKRGYDVAAAELGRNGERREKKSPPARPRDRRAHEVRRIGCADRLREACLGLVVGSCREIAYGFERGRLDLQQE
jgi:hypothetical protein